MDRTRYQNLEIPPQLAEVVEQAIVKGRKRRAGKTRRIVGRVTSLAAVFCICFVGLLNLSPAFASSLYEIPVVGEVCRIFTFRTYEKQTPVQDVEVEVPQIEHPEEADYVERLNQQINLRVDEAVQEAEQRSQAYYDAFVATGGDPADFLPVQIDVSYEIKCSNERWASFVITKAESSANAYNEQIFYNLDWQTSKEFTLEDWFGADYQQIITDSITETIASWSEEQQSLLFPDTVIADHINENTQFYLNEDGQIVIVFPRYEIAVGAAGTLEFPILAE